ncbi:peroxisomal oxidase [Marasmius fiardii PR-910]|nr:peroxisomal oxidase [Marasmius fiardii PR-910]
MSQTTGFGTQNLSDMQTARNRATVDIPVVRDYLYDGREIWEHMRDIISIISKDPTFNLTGKEFMTRTQQYTKGLAKMKRIDELQEEHGWTNSDVMFVLFAMGESLPIHLHNVAFEPVFLSQASKELLKKYAGLVIHRGILGCYLQTELGHGTNVGALETTATYLSDTQEFELHSPTMTSTKWWIGALGKTATHGVVQAKLILPDGTDVGPHLFFVQLRSLDDHRLLPGIITGDIGPKAMGGYSANDNGFARFDHVRIPKSHMLSKFAQVTDQGTYVKPPHAKVSYGGMLYIRSGMVTAAGWNVAKAITIAIRYATVRRQGSKGPDGLEIPVIQYPSVHVRLFPILARAYVFIELGRAMTKSFTEMSERLATGDTSLLAELHATTSGLKVLCSSASVQDMETTRRSMGGHGYSAFAGIGKQYANHLPSVTFEGENHVLDQQVVRAALKAFTTLFENLKSQRQNVTELASSLPPSSAYLRRLLPRPDNHSSEPPILSETSWSDPSVLITLLEWRASLLVHELAQTNQSPDATIYQRVSKASTEAFVAGRVGEMLTLLSKSKMSSKDQEVVRSLYLLYLLTTMEASLTDFLSFGLLRFPHRDSQTTARSRDPTRGLRLTIARLCEDLLPEAIGLTDAFGFTDWELNSALGVYDGQVYKALWERVQEEPLNRTEVPEGYDEFIRPLLLRGQRLARAVKL